MTAPTLAEFLLARIADDEAHVNGWCEDYVPCGQHEHPGHRSEVRTRAECEAKRRIVALLAGASPAFGEWESDGASTAHDACLALTTVYADHPDYDEAWRP